MRLRIDAMAITLRALCARGLFVTSLFALGCTDQGPKSELTWSWRTPISPAGSVSGWLGTPGADESHAYVEVYGRVVESVAAASGQVAWRHTVDGGLAPAAGNIVVSRGHVVIAEGTEAVALDSGTGAELWRYTSSAQGGQSIEQSADSEMFYFGERTHRITALNLSSGGPLWSVDYAPNAQFATTTWGTAVSGDTVYVAAVECTAQNCYTNKGLIVALDRMTGAEIWRYETPEDFGEAVGITVAGNELLVTDVYTGSYYAVDRFTHIRLWRNHAQGSWAGSQVPPSVSGNVGYVGMQDQYVYAFDVATGQLLWQTKVAGGVFGVSVCGDKIIATHLGLSVLDRSTGKLLGSWGTGDAPEFPTTAGAGISADHAVVSGHVAVYGFAC